MAEVISRTPLILLTDEGETIDVGSRSAHDLLENKSIKWEELDADRRKKLIEHFMSMGFFHFRVKKYIEIRVADSVPLDKALGYVALIKGIVYSDKNLRLLNEVLSNIRDIESIQNVVEAIERDGFNAVVYNGKTAGEWADHLYDLAEKALGKEDREYLQGVRTIWSNSEQKNTNKQPA